MHMLGDMQSADALSDQEVVTAITEITHAQNRAAAQKYALLAQFGRRALHAKSGHSSPAHYIAAGTRVSIANANRQFATAAWLTEWPTVADALADSDIYVDHVKEIYDGYGVMRTADPQLPEDSMTATIADLLATAFDGTAMQVRQRVQVLAHAATEDARVRYQQEMRERQEQEKRDAERNKKENPDNKPTDKPDPPDPPDPPAPGPRNGPPPQPVSENRALNKLDLYLQSNGRTILKGDLDKVLAEKFRAALSPLSRPQPAPDGTRDPRSTSLRQADGLSRLLDQRAGNGRTGGPGIQPSTVNVTVNLRDLLAETPTPTNHSATTKSDSKTPGGHRTNTGGSNSSGGGPGSGGNTGRSTSSGPRDGRPGRGGNTGGPGDAGSGPRNENPGGDGCAGGNTGSGGNTGNTHGSNNTGSGGTHTRHGSADARGGTDEPSDTRTTPTMGDPDWPFHLQWTGPISRSLARLLTCDADLNPIIVDDNGVPLAMGMTERLATPEQRIAVAVRDRCCIKCGLPAQWCQVHHVIFWEDGGPTDLTNLVLVCGDCHRHIHNHGWDVDFGDDGHPRLIPPAELDAERKPIPSFHRQRRPAS